MTDPRIIAEYATYDGQVDALRARMTELGLTFQQVDALSGLASGYAAKCLGPKHSKKLAELSFGLLAETLAVKFLMVVDEEALQRMEKRYEKRVRPATVRTNVRTLRATWLLTPRDARKIVRKRWANTTPAERSKIARRLNRIRWRRERAKRRQIRESKRLTSQCASAQPAPVKNPTQNQTATS